MTRDDLVERMARALYKFERGTDPYADQDWDEAQQRYYARKIAAALTELEKHAVVVPAEPTAEMQRAGYYDADHSIEGVGDLAPPPEEQPRLIYLAMLAARPR